MAVATIFAPVPKRFSSRTSPMRTTAGADRELTAFIASNSSSRGMARSVLQGMTPPSTVGAVVADILPYLGVQRNYTEDDAAGQSIVIENLTGLPLKEAEKLLRSRNLTARIIGTGETVTGQIPAVGQTVPGMSEVLLYLGETVPETTVEVPDFSGMNRAQATAAAGKLGLYILVTGNDGISPKVVVTLQDIPAGTEVSAGTTIQLQFTDTGARD